MRFKYVGPHKAVDLPGVGQVERGTVVDIPAPIASGLRDQETWEQVKTAQKRPESEVKI